MLLVSLLASMPSAYAQDCDAKALQADIAEATPVGAAMAFVKLADCDAGAAAKVAPDVVPRLLGGEEGNEAALRAIEVGAAAPVVAWMDKLQPDERARAIRALGKACSESEPVQKFFAERAGALGEAFWSDRWYTGLASCRTPALQGVLSEELSKGIGTDRMRYFSVLETYARSAGADAVPRLKELSTAVKDDEAEANIVAAFADAARVGTPEGADPKTAAAAAEAIREVAPMLQVKGVEQARMTLLALGDEEGSDLLAAVRFKDVDQGGGTFLWGAVAEEKATCKNGKVSQRLHVGQVNERGNTWPDQLQERVAASGEVTWELDLAKRCKGEGTVTWHVSDGPFADEAAWSAWAEDTVKSVRDDGASKVVRVDAAALQI